MTEKGSRPYDLVLFGATGFTGGLVAAYLAEHGPAELKWALAGRNREKLEGVRSQLGEAHAELPLLVADISDADSMRAVAESARVAITTVGPYINYGEPLVAACAAAGTDYVDLTGEPEFVDLMYLRHHRQAAETGARLVHSCGFDSIPYDLGALFAVNQLPDDVPIALRGFGLASGRLSGGTLQSAIHAMARLRQSTAAARQRRAQEDAADRDGRRVRGIVGRPHDEPLAGGWVVPAPTIDPQHVLRSARALPVYGPDFSYSHFIVTRKLATTAALIGGVGLVAGVAQLPPGREALLRLASPGNGPSPEQRARAFFRVRMVGETPDPQAKRVIAQVSGGDPGYGETSKMLAESALCLAFDELPARSGQLTPAVAMGQRLIDRLDAAGISFRVLED